MSLAPLPDALDMGGAGEVIAVAWLLEPAVLAGGFAGLPARELGAVALAPGAARVRSKEGLTVLALALGVWTSHEPASPQAHDLQIVAETEENGGRKTWAEAQRRRRKKGRNMPCGEEDGTVYMTSSP